jgi:hypothetical protein
MSDRPFTSYDKWILSGLTGSLFLSLSSPIFDSFFDYTNFKLKGIELTLVKAVLFTVIIRILLSLKKYQNKEDTSGTRNIISVINGLLFIVLTPTSISTNIFWLLSSFIFYTLIIRTLIN